MSISAIQAKALQGCSEFVLDVEARLVQDASYVLGIETAYVTDPQRTPEEQNYYAARCAFFRQCVRGQADLRMIVYAITLDAAWGRTLDNWEANREAAKGDIGAQVAAKWNVFANAGAPPA